jgi:hypothetical protein
MNIFRESVMPKFVDKRLHLFLLALFLVLQGCSLNTQELNHNSVPQWVSSPDLDEFSQGQRVAVGCSYIHAKGESAQRALALERAISQIALQKRSTVNVESLNTKKYSKGELISHRTYSVSHQSVEKSQVSVIAKEWYTKPDGTICVLAVEE